MAHDRPPCARASPTSGETGLHVQGVAEHEANAFLGAEIGDPVPGEQALDGADGLGPIRRPRVKEHACRPEVACGKRGGRCLTQLSKYFLRTNRRYGPALYPYAWTHTHAHNIVGPPPVQ